MDEPLSVTEEENMVVDDLANYKLSIQETSQFDQFVTVDKVAEENLNVLVCDDKQRDTRFLTLWGKYRQLVWSKSKTFVTLTAMAIMIGLFAGFIQIFTETLVNWKTGHCARNFLLNKSFCCSEAALEILTNSSTTKITKNDKSLPYFYLHKRDELQCIDQGLWIEWDGNFKPFTIFITLSLSFALLSTLLVQYIAPMATGSGISEIKVWISGFEYKSNFLNLTTLIVKSIALPLAISSGLSLGKEGPSVHYATCCAFLMTNWLLKKKLTYSSQFEYLTAGGSAGVAVAFGAPIGGVLFGLEELSSATDFNSNTLWKSYYVALIAVTTLKCINPFRNGKIILFNVTYDKNWKVGEVPVFIVLGIFGGLYGKYISKLNIQYVHFRKVYLKNWPTQEIIILALITSFISYFNEFLKLDMTESMGILFHECTKLDDDENSVFAHRLCYLDEHTHVFEFITVMSSLFMATIIRSCLVIISYGAKVPAGIFVPSMAVGATFGRLVSLFVERFICGTGTITSGAYAFLGAAATLCGITNLTLTVVVIMLELTGAFIYIIPTMIVVAIARIILNSSETSGIADQMIKVNGFPLIEYEMEPEVKDFMEGIKVEQIMTKKLITLNETMFVSELEQLIYSNSQNSNNINTNDNKLVNGFPVRGYDGTNNDVEPRCIGYVLRRHLVQKLLYLDISSKDANRILVHFNPHDNIDENDAENISFADINNNSPVIVKPSVSTSMLYRMFKHIGCKAIMVEEFGILQGIITCKDILKFERYISRKKIGVKYKYDDELNNKIWSFCQPIIRKFTGSR